MGPAPKKPKGASHGKQPQEITKKHGGKEHFKGEKAAWLVSKAGMFQAAQDAGRTGEFYSFITREFIKDFGDNGSGDFTLEEEKNVGQDVSVVDENMRGASSQEEADAASKRSASLRIVSSMHSGISGLILIERRTIQKLSQWFRHRYKSVVSPTATQGFSGLFGRDTWTAPKKRSALQTYTKQYYTSHIKAEYEHRFAAARLEWDMASEAQRVQKKMEIPVPVGFRAKVIYEFWKAETQDVREQMEQVAADEHMRALDDWNTMKTAPMTAHQFHQCVSNYLIHALLTCCAVNSNLSPNMSARLQMLSRPKCRLQCRSR